MSDRVGILGSVVLAITLPAWAVGQSVSTGADAATILQAKCLTCHGAARMSDLDLRTTEAMLKGGKRAPAVTPGNAAASLLYRAVRREGDLQMPPGKIPLTSAEIGVLRDWIDAGARMAPARGDAAARDTERWVMP